MSDLLKEIVQVDQDARKRLEQAQNERAEAYAGMAARKEALIGEEKQKARKRAEAMGEMGKAAGEQRLAAIRERSAAVLEKMNSEYRQKKDEWVEDIVAGVLSAGEV